MNRYQIKKFFWSNDYTRKRVIGCRWGYHARTVNLQCKNDEEGKKRFLAFCRRVFEQNAYHHPWGLKIFSSGIFDGAILLRLYPSGRKRMIDEVDFKEDFDTRPFPVGTS